MKRLYQGLILVFAAGCSAVTYSVELVFYNWEDYIAESVLQKFEQETGHTVKTVIYDRDKERDEVLASTGGKGFDLVIVDSISTQILGKNNILSPINESRYKQIDSRWQESCGNFGLPYMWGTVGIVYRADILEKPPTSWKDLLQPAPMSQGKVGMHIDPVDTLIPALKLMGESLNEETPQNLKVAYELLKKQSAAVATYEYIISYVSAENGESHEPLHMALAYSGDHYTLNGDDEEPWEYVVPSEGTGLWVDCLGIPSASENKEAAIAFVEFINRADIAAENSLELWVATPNREALKLLDEDVLQDETLFPSAEVMSKSEIYRILSNKSVSQRNRIVYSLER